MRLDARDTVGSHIYNFGIWEPNLTSWIKDRLRPGDVFVDVGASVGYYSLLASQLVGESGRVVAIEALPETFGVLETNLEKNHARNVRAVNVAAWDSDESVTLFAHHAKLSCSTTTLRPLASQRQLHRLIKVPASPLSAILRTDEVRLARLIKIDVEGAEWRAVSGLLPILPHCRQDLELAVEVSAKMLELESRTAEDFLNLFRSQGFNAYRIMNEYSAAAYIEGLPPSRPERLLHVPATINLMDLIFSRVDALSL